MENKVAYQDPNTYQAPENRFVDKKRSNIKSDLIEITHDKLEIILLKHIDNINIYKAWITPFSLFLTLIIARLTATFNDFIGIKAAVWDALFILGMLASFIWLIYTIVNIIRCWRKGTLEFLLNEIKNAKD